MGKLLQVALDKSGCLKSIYDVETGKECGCFCPNPTCNQPLIAKNNNKTADKELAKGKKTAHFSHFDGSICATARESAIHLLAKKILVENPILYLPSYFYKDKKIIQAKEYKFDKATPEMRVLTNIDYFYPDVILELRSKKIYIEFCKSHKVDDNKIEKIKMQNVSCLEIDVNCIDPLIDGKVNDEGMQSYLVTTNPILLSKRFWIHNAEAEKLYAREIDKEEKERIEKERQDAIKYENFEIARKRLLSDFAEKIKNTKKTVNEIRKTGCDTKLVSITEHANYTDESIVCPENIETVEYEVKDLSECGCCPYHYGVFEEGPNKYAICSFFYFMY